jgi:hypothetical protein
VLMESYTHYIVKINLNKTIIYKNFLLGGSSKILLNN